MPDKNAEGDWIATLASLAYPGLGQLRQCRLFPGLVFLLLDLVCLSLFHWIGLPALCIAWVLRAVAAFDAALFDPKPVSADEAKESRSALPAAC